MRGPARPYVHTLSTFMRVYETPVDMYGRFFVLAHDDTGVGAADEVAPILNFPRCANCHFRLLIHVHKNSRYFGASWPRIEYSIWYNLYI
jgi:hypothetical protein